jgi:tRNA nucleotidyltransferase/poly(A) polymerase
MLPFNRNIFPQTQSKGPYIVGGSVRDLLLGRTPVDFDIVVLEDAKKYADKMATQTSGHLVELGNGKHTLYRLIIDNRIFDVSGADGASIEDDLKKRDFTINAMAYDVPSGQIVDRRGGKQDLADKKIRMVSRSVFKEDPVRLIRAYRMGANLAYDIDPETVSAIKSSAHLIVNSAGERIREELFKILSASIAHRYLSQMEDSGLLFAIFPELASLKGCLQNRYHRFDAFDHSMQAFLHLENILNNPGSYLAEFSQITKVLSEKNRMAVLKYSILLHDIGKPLVRTQDHRGNIHFYGHGKKSVAKLKSVNQRLKLSNYNATYAEFIVRNHLRPLFLFRVYQRKTKTQKAATRFFLKCGDWVPDLLLHALADFMGKGNAEDIRTAAFRNFARNMLEHYYSDFKPRKSMHPLITGYDLINTFGLAPSPLFKEILTQVEEARLSGSIHSKSQAEKWVKEYLKSARHSTKQ